MKTSIFVLILIVVVFMAGAMVLNVVYRKHVEKQKTTPVSSEPFVVMPAFSPRYTQYPFKAKKTTFKPIVMDLTISDHAPF